MVKATVSASGDTSEGKLPTRITIDGLPNGLADHRAEWRAILSFSFQEILDDSVDVIFDDECPDCFSTVGHRHNCPTKSGVTGRF